MSHLIHQPALRAPLKASDSADRRALAHEMVRLEDEHRSMAREAVACSLYGVQRGHPMRDYDDGHHEAA